MLTYRIASLAAAIVVGGGTLLAASGADAGIGMNGMSLNGIMMNGIPMNGWSLNGLRVNGANASAVASQDFDFNNVAVRALTWDCPLPLDRKAVVFCAIGTSP